MLRNYTHQPFGAFRGSTTQAGQLAPEAIAVGTKSVACPGSSTHSRYSFQAIPSGTFTASMTVWYSLLPNPDETNDGHWFQDTDIGTINFAAGTNVGKLLGNACVPWVRYKVVVASGTLSLCLFHEVPHSD